MKLNAKMFRNIEAQREISHSYKRKSVMEKIAEMKMNSN